MYCCRRGMDEDLLVAHRVTSQLPRGRVRGACAAHSLIQPPDMTQIGRLREINNLDDITVDLVNAARQTLVIGTQ